ncbi:MAG: hypothetical protein EU533_07120 [Promethearchaeota archaeon]|nr:MAG: hypothetical protein EU533_07120 [Candidatus Lokiarchaeota archaeon]
MDLLKDRNKLFIVMIIPTLIIATILFYFEFTLAADPPFISLVGFALLIGSGAFIYFTNTKKLKETKDKKDAIKGYLLYMLPTIIISVLLFILISPPAPPYLLPIGLVVFLVAYTGVYFLAVKAVLE